jgi:mannose-1-phosphate guanylyltransferase
LPHDEAAADDVVSDQVEDARAYGCVPTDPGGRVSAFSKRCPVPSATRSTQAAVFRRRVIDEIPAPGRP